MIKSAVQMLNSGLFEGLRAFALLPVALVLVAFLAVREYGQHRLP